MTDRLVCVRAWLLTEGNLLPSGARILSVRRDPTTYEVAVATDDGGRWSLPGDIRVAVTRPRHRRWR
jgi:hypothetical protein